MFVFVHIPKTAGTALGYGFDYSTNRRVFWDYSPNYEFPDKLQPEIRDHMDFISTYFKAIYGHFFVTKYMETLPDANYLTCIRQPVSRVVSQYFHAAHDGRSWQGKAIANGEMNAVEFARSEMIANAQYQHLKGKDLEDFGHIFITERLAPSVSLFSRKFDFKFQVGIPTLNTKENRDKSSSRSATHVNSKILPVTERDRQKIFQLCEMDNDIYRRAVNLHKAELKANA